MTRGEQGTKTGDSFLRQVRFASFHPPLLSYLLFPPWAMSLLKTRRLELVDVVATAAREMPMPIWGKSPRLSCRARGGKH